MTHTATDRPWIRIGVLLVLLLQTALVRPDAARAQGDMFLIRDTEIEETIQLMVQPVFEAAGLDPENVKIHLVNQKSLNAFVADGQQIFIHTGLLRRAENPGQVIGVLAHETGHIAGGHLNRLHTALRHAQAEAIAAMLLGVAAGVATGDPRAGIAINALGQTAAQGSVLAYSRSQESAADAAAMRFLDQSALSSRGLLEFLRILQREEKLFSGQSNAYLRSHPLTNDRIAAVDAHLQVSQFAAQPWPADLERRHRRLRAKLDGFLSDLAEVQRLHPDPLAGPDATYAHAIAQFRRGSLDAALELVDRLIDSEPDNPWFHELKGQMLFENGRIAASVAPWREAVRLAPGAPLLLTGLARAEIESGDATLLQPALRRLEDAVIAEPDLAMAWRMLATVHGRLGNEGALSLAMAEGALIRGDFDQALALAERARRQLPHGAAKSLRAADIEAEARRRLDPANR